MINEPRIMSTFAQLNVPNSRPDICGSAFEPRILHFCASTVPESLSSAPRETFCNWLVDCLMHETLRKFQSAA